MKTPTIVQQIEIVEQQMFRYSSDHSDMGRKAYSDWHAILMTLKNNISEFDSNGIHVNGTKFDESGYDCNGLDKNYKPRHSPTPGPWKFGQEDDERTVYNVLNESLSMKVLVSGYNARSNARLIAKSPQLLEMVKSLKLALSGYMAESETAMSTDYKLLDDADELLKDL